MIHAKICAYRLPDGARIEEAVQRDGNAFWAVRKNGACLNKAGDWECEPMPSARDDEFLSRCRWSTPEFAYEAWQHASIVNRDGLLRTKQTKREKDIADRIILERAIEVIRENQDSDSPPFRM